MSSGQRQDRRRRERKAWVVPAIVYLGERVLQVELQDVSRDLERGGAGFLCGGAIDVGREVYVKVGLGPLRQPRAGRVIHCRRRPDGQHWVGVEFDAAQQVEAA